MQVVGHKNLLDRIIGGTAICRLHMIALIQTLFRENNANKRIFTKRMV